MGRLRARATPCDPSLRLVCECECEKSAAISLIAEPAPQPRVYERIASRKFGFRLSFSAGVCIEARATGFSVCVGLVWRSVRLYLSGTRLWDLQTPLITRWPQPLESIKWENT